MTPTDILWWVITHPELATITATTLAGLLGAGRHYQRTGKIPLSTLPLRAFRRLGYWFRKYWFTTPRPDKEPFVVNDALETVRETLGANSFMPGWPLSYHYYGEDLNARRYYFDPDRKYPHRQIHVRGFDGEDGVELIAHEEPDPWHHPQAHLRSRDLYDATSWVTQYYGEPSMDPRSYDPPVKEG